jgi:lipid II isoglutaminyl synthase (glutamine-hydrolysing)
MALKITVAYLYPEVMNTYGDRGNVQTIVRRCAWRGITAKVQELRIGDRMQADDTDLIMIGNGGECGQALITTDLAGKGQAIKDAVGKGAGALAVGGGYELFGQYCRPSEGADLAGIGLFDAWTIRRGTDLKSEQRSIAAARADRAIGDLVVQWGNETLVGFENHGGRTYLGPSAQPLGSVVVGHGNNGDGTEGVQLGNAIGTYLRGPCLPRNPALADFLISAAVTCRYGPADGADLQQLPDDLEVSAHDIAVSRVLGDHSHHRAWFSRLRPGPGRSKRAASVLPLAEHSVTTTAATNPAAANTAAANTVPATETLQAGS